MRDVAISLVLTAFLCAAQEDTETLFKSDAHLVDLHATVTDPQGRLLTDLHQSDFKVFENGVPQEIKVFRLEDAPVSLGLIIDNSASMRSKRAQVAAALLTLVHASNPDDEEFVMNFSERPVMAQDFTQDIQKLESTLGKIDSSGPTAMRDALSMGLEHLKRLAKNDEKVLLVVTDGEDNSSVETLTRLSREAQQSGVLIYAIGLLNDEDARATMRAKRDLDMLTRETGGEVFYPKELAEVDGIAQHVAHDLRNQYTVAYIPSNQNQDGTFRTIKVTVSTPADAVVRARTGYYAPEKSGP